MYTTVESTWASGGSTAPTVQSVEGILKGFSGRINLRFNIAARSGDSVRDRKMALGGVRQRLYVNRRESVVV